MFTNKHSSIHVLLCIVVTRNSEWCFVLLHFWFCLKFEIKLGFLCFKNVITRVWLLLLQCVGLLVETIWITDTNTNAKHNIDTGNTTSNLRK
jgi:hypothetical protein